jgi:hypothetical protein
MLACATAAFAVLAVAACTSTPSGAGALPSVKATATASPTPAHTTAPAVPVLKPGGSATFQAGQETAATATVTWSMGATVVRVPDTSYGQGFEDVAFNLTVKNIGTVAVQGDPTFTTSLLARSPDGRTDETLQGAAALKIYDGTHGLNGSDLELESGVTPGSSVAGYVSWPVPGTTTTVFVLNPNTNQPELQIDLPAS